MLKQNGLAPHALKFLSAVYVTPRFARACCTRPPAPGDCREWLASVCFLFTPCKTYFLLVAGAGARSGPVLFSPVLWCLPLQHSKKKKVSRLQEEKHGNKTADTYRCMSFFPKHLISSACSRLPGWKCLASCWCFLGLEEVAVEIALDENVVCL